MRALCTIESTDAHDAEGLGLVIYECSCWRTEMMAENVSQSAGTKEEDILTEDGA